MGNHSAPDRALERVPGAMRSGCAQRTESVSRLGRSAFAVVALASIPTLWPALAPVQRGRVTALLDAYYRGDQARAVADLRTASEIERLRSELKREGSEWVRVPEPSEARRRRLAAAAFALELTQFYRWPEDVDPLVEWGCQLLRQDVQPVEVERSWFRASVAIFTRARDDGILVTRGGSIADRGYRLPPLPRQADHVAHARTRFPDEPRFVLAGVILFAGGADTEPARDADWVSTGDLPKESLEAWRRERAAQAINLFERLLQVPDLKAEAHLRIGILQLTLRQHEPALKHFGAVADASDRFVAYLARLNSGRVLEAQGQLEQAEAMYRRARAAIPHAQSAATALTALLFRRGQIDESLALAAEALAAHDDDPWHQVGYGDLRLLPDLMSTLRETIR